MILSFAFIILLLISIDSIKYEFNKESCNERYYNYDRCINGCDSVYSSNRVMDTDVTRKQKR